jgi:hypothetical protein
MDTVTAEARAPALPVFYVEDEARLLDAFGVEGVETPESRIVKIAAGPRRSLVMSGSSVGDPEGGEGPGRVAGVVT